MSQTLQAVRGMNDILPDDAETWEYFEDIVRDWLQSYGYRPIRMPLVEPTPLFKRAIGEVTDIVEKEMYSFEDALNGEHLTLRPEGTASCVRAAIQHNLIPSAARSGCTTTARCSATSARRRAATASSTRSAWRPSALPAPDTDAELILMCARLWDDLGLEDVALEINSLGSPEERAQHRAALIAYLEQHRTSSTRTASAACTPTRCASSTPRTPSCRRSSRPRPGSPTISATSRRRTSTRCRSSSRMPASRTASTTAWCAAWTTTTAPCSSGSPRAWARRARSAPAAATTACSSSSAASRSRPRAFAIGIERLLLLWQECGGEAERPVPDAYVVSVGEAAQRLAIRAAESLREHGFAVLMHCGGGSFKSQMKKADASEAPVAIVIGEDEAAAGEVGLKPLRGGGAQQRVALEALPEAMAGVLYSEQPELEA
jgi:histidyl-tRNA synthetase